MLISEGDDLVVYARSRGYRGRSVEVLRISGTTGKMTLKAGPKFKDGSDVLSAAHISAAPVSSLAAFEEAKATVQDFLEIVGRTHLTQTVVTGGANDWNFLSDKTRSDGTLAFLTDLPGLYTQFSATMYGTPPTGEDGQLHFPILDDNSKIMVRIDKTHLPYKSHTNFYIGNILGEVPAAISVTGLVPEAPLFDVIHLARFFGNSVEGFKRTSTIHIADDFDIGYGNLVPTVDPFPPMGDFGGAVCAEVDISSPVTFYHVVRMIPSGNAATVTHAMADSAPHSAKVLGVALNSGTTGAGSRRAVIVKYRDTAPVAVETGITMAIGDTAYLSDTEAGTVTNVAPVISFVVGQVLEAPGEGPVVVRLKL